MKKIGTILVLLLSVVLVGCQFNFTTTTTLSTKPLLTGTTTTTIDLSRLYSEVYARIYEEMYEAVRQEVIDNLATDQFEELYQQALEDILVEIQAGNIEISPQTVVERIRLVANAQANSVVGISNYDAAGNLTGTGSGVLFRRVGDKYYVITNQHVVKDGSSFEVVFEDGRTIQAILRGVDELVDIAVLYFVDSSTYPIATFADSNLVQKGDMILAVGNPSGFQYYGSATFGIISGVERYFDTDGDGSRDMFVNYIQHDAAINKGNSGGALFNLDGDVIGINVIKISSVEIEGMGFAIPSNLARIIADEIIEFGVSNRMVYLGVGFYDLSALTAADRNELVPPIPASVTRGFYVISVDSRGSLANVIQAGDVILQIGSIEIENSVQFVRERFETYRVGDVVSIVIWRNNQTITIQDIVLKSRN